MLKIPVCVCATPLNLPHVEFYIRFLGAVAPLTAFLFVIEAVFL